MSRHGAADAGSAKASSPDPWPLSDREVLVIEMLARNVRRREIARELGCSTVTVDRLVSNLRDRCSVRTTVELVVRAVRAGVI